MSNNYSVYVDGTEVNDFYVSKEIADQIGEQFTRDGYENVEVIKSKSHTEECTVLQILTHGKECFVLMRDNETGDSFIFANTPRFKQGYNVFSTVKIRLDLKENRLACIFEDGSENHIEQLFKEVV